MTARHSSWICTRVSVPEHPIICHPEPFGCHAERSEASGFELRVKLREGSRLFAEFILSVGIEILRFPQDDERRTQNDNEELSNNKKRDESVSS